MSPSEAIGHLKRAGLTEQSIAGKVGASQSTINRVLHGMQPTYGLGKALVDLAQQTALPASADPDDDRVIVPVEEA